MVGKNHLSQGISAISEGEIYLDIVVEVGIEAQRCTAHPTDIIDRIITVPYEPLQSPKQIHIQEAYENKFAPCTAEVKGLTKIPADRLALHVLHVWSTRSQS